MRIMDSSTITLAPSRFVTIELASRLIGLTDKAIRRKIEDGVWAEGKQYRRRDGRVFIDIKGVETWVEHGQR